MSWLLLLTYFIELESADIPESVMTIELAVYSVNVTADLFVITVSNGSVQTPANKQ